MNQHVRVEWKGKKEFAAGRPEAPMLHIDGSAQTGPSPVDALLGALGSCISVDVVDILQKRRTPAKSLRVEIEAMRAETAPRYVTSAMLTFFIEGDDIDRVHAERAIDLSVTKYCSVRDSLRPDTTITWTLTLNGEPSGTVRRG